MCDSSVLAPIIGELAAKGGLRGWYESLVP